MHDLPAKNERTRTRTITAAGNRTCIITLRLSDFKSQTSLTLLLRHYELTNENVSYFLTNQLKMKTFIDLKVGRKPKPTKNMRPWDSCFFYSWDKDKRRWCIPPQVNEIAPQKSGVTSPSPTTIIGFGFRLIWTVMPSRRVLYASVDNTPPPRHPPSP